MNNTILTLIQTITELLPISSSGHLILYSILSKTPIDQTLLTYLHFWTALGLIIYYFPTLITFLKTKKGLIKLLTIGLATLFPALMGVLFDDAVELYFYNAYFIAGQLIFWGILMILIEIKIKSIYPKLINIKNDFLRTMIIGASQAIALLPGTSRSGISTMTGMICKLDKKEALDTAFLLGIPITLGPFIFELLKEPDIISSFISPQYLLNGLLSVIVTFVLLKFVFSKGLSRFFTIWGSYRILLGVIVVIAQLF